MGKTRGGTVKSTDADAGGLLLGADADGIDGDMRLAGQLLGRFGRDAGVLAAIADDHDAGDRRVPPLADRLHQGLSQAGLVAAGNEVLAQDGAAAFVVPALAVTGIPALAGCWVSFPFRRRLQRLPWAA